MTVNPYEPPKAKSELPKAVLPKRPSAVEVIITWAIAAIITVILWPLTFSSPRFVVFTVMILMFCATCNTILFVYRRVNK